MSGMEKSERAPEMRLQLRSQSGSGQPARAVRGPGWWSGRER